MTNFEQHIGYELPQAILDHIDEHSTDEIYNQAHRLRFQSTCPVLMENDSPELRKELKEASELLFKYIDFQLVTE